MRSVSFRADLSAALLAALIASAAALTSASWPAFAQPATPPKNSPPARASTLKASERAALTGALERLQQARRLLLATISDCSGGEIMVVACQRPAAPAACTEAVASCDTVAALRAIDGALAQTEAALKH